MKLATYEAGQRCTNYSDKAFELKRGASAVYEHLDLHLPTPYLEAIFRLIDPKGKTVLDLGCGSKNSADSQFLYEYTPWEPWLLRALHEYGANCIGVDIGGLDGEKFVGFKRDLKEKDSLSILETHSVDIACAFSFFDSPFLNHGGERAFRNLLPQLERIVKPEGFFLFDTLRSGYKDMNESETAPALRQ